MIRVNLRSRVVIGWRGRRTSNRLANSCRKRRFPKEGRKHEVVVYRERTERLEKERERRERTRHQINGLLRSWRKDLASGGTNNAISCAGVETVVQRLSKLGRFSRGSSVFVDLGCSVGIPSIYVALLTGARTIGIEKDAELVARARKNAEACGVSERCTFVCMDLNELTPEWFSEQSVTHVMAFDAVFGEKVLTHLYECLAAVQGPLVGAGTSTSCRYWSPFLTQVGRSSTAVKLAGRGASSFRFRFWRK